MKWKAYTYVHKQFDRLAKDQQILRHFRMAYFQTLHNIFIGVDGVDFILRNIIL